MSPENQRIAIATACGWKANVDGLGYYQGVHPALMGGRAIPDYINDLNACHEMEKVLDYEQCEAFSTTLADIVHAANREKDYAFPWAFARIHATAAERCEAFLRVMGLWEKEANTTKSVSPTSPAIEQADHETAEEKVAWLKILLCTKSCDPVFTDYWLRLARRNLRLGLPLTTPEPELNPSTEESSATGSEPLLNGTTYTRSYQVFLPNPTQPNL